MDTVLYVEAVVHFCSHDALQILAHGEDASVAERSVHMWLSYRDAKPHIKHSATNS